MLEKYQVEAIAGSSRSFRCYCDTCGEALRINRSNFIEGGGYRCGDCDGSTTERSGHAPAACQDGTWNTIIEEESFKKSFQE
ncbi:MAG: hypothetical protein ACYSW3_22485 [Planctomycetota bacterium]